LIKQHVLWSE